MTKSEPAEAISAPLRTEALERWPVVSTSVQDLLAKKSGAASSLRNPPTYPRRYR
jgi:hypothetical protein